MSSWIVNKAEYCKIEKSVKNLFLNVEKQKRSPYKDHEKRFWTAINIFEINLKIAVKHNGRKSNMAALLSKIKQTSKKNLKKN